MTIADFGFNLYWPESVPPTPEIIDRIAHRHAWAFLNSDHTTLADLADLLGPNDYSWVIDLSAQIRAEGGDVKVGYYCGGLSDVDSHYPPYDWLADADLLHHPDGTPATVAPALSPAEPGSRRLKFPNLTSAAVRAKLIANWVVWLKANGFDGLLYDGWHAEFFASRFADTWMPAGALEGAVGTPLFWATAFSTYTTELTAAFESQGLECWVNGLKGPEDDAGYTPGDAASEIEGPTNVRVTLYSDGALAEATNRIWLGGSLFTDFLVQADRVAEIGGRVLYFFQPWIIQFSDPDEYADPNFQARIDSGQMARFYLASTLLVHRPGFTIHGYNPNIAYFGFTTGPNTPVLHDGGTDWDGELGAAIGTYTTDTSGGTTVWYREYERAFVVVNPSETHGGSFGRAGLYRAWDAEAGDPYIVAPDAPLVHIPPRTGLVLYKIAQVITTPWRLPVRAHLYHVVQETDGDIVPNRAVTVYDADGVSAFGQVMYDAPTGGSIVTSPTTDSLGRLSLYAPLGERVKLSIAGVAGQQNSVFTPDPEDLLTVVEPIAVTQVAGDTDYLLTLQPTVGGAGGNKIAHLLAQGGTTALKVGPHGVGSATEVGVTLPVLVIDNDNGAPRIRADLTDGSHLNRLLFQTSTSSGSSDLGVMPNGGTAGSFTAWATADPANAVAVRIADDISSAASIETFGTGSLAANAHPLVIKPGQVEALRFKPNGDVRQPAAGLATTATGGFFGIGSMAGTPTGVPDVDGGSVPLVYDRTANKLWSYNGSWRSTAAFT